MSRSIDARVRVLSRPLLDDVPSLISFVPLKKASSTSGSSSTRLEPVYFDGRPLAPPPPVLSQ